MWFELGHYHLRQKIEKYKKCKNTKYLEIQKNTTNIEIQNYKNTKTHEHKIECVVNVVRAGPLSPLVRCRAANGQVVTWSAHFLTGGEKTGADREFRKATKSAIQPSCHPNVTAAPPPLVLTHGGTFMAMASSQARKGSK